MTLCELPPWPQLDRGGEGGRDGGREGGEGRRSDSVSIATFLVRRIRRMRSGLLSLWASVFLFVCFFFCLFVCLFFCAFLRTRSRTFLTVSQQPLGPDFSNLVYVLTGMCPFRLQKIRSKVKGQGHAIAQSRKNFCYRYLRKYFPERFPTSCARTHSAWPV